MGLLERARAQVVEGSGGKSHGEESEFAPLWRHKQVGDYVVGTVRDIREHDFGHGMTKIFDLIEGECKSDGDVLEGTEFGLPLNTKILKEEAEKRRVMKGDEVYAKFIGWGKSKAGRDYKDFDFDKEGYNEDADGF